MKYQFKNNFFAKAGIQLGLRAKGFDEFTNKVKDDDDLQYKLKTKDEYHPLDAGLAFGIGYRLIKGTGMNIGMQYYLGLVDVVIDDSSPKQFNRSLYLTVGIPIGKKKLTNRPIHKATSLISRVAVTNHCIAFHWVILIRMV